MASMNQIHTLLEQQWNAKKDTGEIFFPLIHNPLEYAEISSMIDVVMSGKWTMGHLVEKAEKDFGEAVGAEYAVMVNSGSSANLLAMSALCNIARPKHLNKGDKVLVPAVCWSTSLFPILQHGLVPVFVDSDSSTMNINLNHMERTVLDHCRLTREPIKGIVAVHILGNSCNVEKFMDLVDKYDLLVLEDTCESLGSTVSCKDGKRMLGTFGDFGTYSFYFSHHITSVEGGMIVCKTLDDYNLLRCLRSHGWTRHLTNKAEIENLYPDIDPRFLFVNLGYNFRPMEIQAAVLSVQLQKLEMYNSFRRNNYIRIKDKLTKFGYLDYMRLMDAAQNTDPAWFGLAVILNKEYAPLLKKYLEYLTKKGVENRPIVSGNFARQPCVKMYCPGVLPESYPGAEEIHTRGFFIGIHQKRIDDNVISFLASIMIKFFEKCDDEILY